MQKQNIISLKAYRIQKDQRSSNQKPMSQELKKAIKSLIHQLKEKGPII